MTALVQSKILYVTQGGPRVCDSTATDLTNCDSTNNKRSQYCKLLIIEKIPLQVEPCNSNSVCLAVNLYLFTTFSSVRTTRQILQMFLHVEHMLPSSSKVLCFQTRADSQQQLWCSSYFLLGRIQISGLLLEKAVLAQICLKGKIQRNRKTKNN